MFPSADLTENTQGHHEIYCQLLPTCTVATVLIVLRCGSNLNSFFNHMSNLQFCYYLFTTDLVTTYRTVILIRKATTSEVAHYV